MTQTSAARWFIAPPRYVQGPHMIDLLGELIGHSSVAVLVDAFLSESLSPRIWNSLSRRDIRARLLPISGEVTARHIDTLSATVGAFRPTAIVAVGGGKTLDLGKGVSRSLGLPVVTVPTIASNDGPTSRVIATYDDDHHLVATPTMSWNPELVVVDTELIARAPVRFLLSGIGDAFAKEFEVRACVHGTGNASNGGRPLQLPVAIAAQARATLTADAADAVAAVTAGRVDDALERVIEAVVLMSGLAFENGGLSLAHALTRGLMAVPECSRELHGFHVAYGLLVQTQHEGLTDEFGKSRSFFARIGLPTTLSDLGVTPDGATVDAIVAPTLDAPHMANCQPRPTRESLSAAVWRVESAR